MRWHGYCAGCKRYDLAVESRPEHFQQTRCDVCAARPPRPSLATSTDLTDFQIRRSARVSDEQAAAWERERRVAELELPQPNWISGVLKRLERCRLPVEGLGIRHHALSACPLCRAPMRLTFGEQLVDLVCAGGCAEDHIAASIAGGAR